MVRVVSIDRRMAKGVTHPCIARVDDGETFNAFIKLKDNPEGDRCLINELVSYRLAKALGVLMPDSGVAVIDENTADNTGCTIKESSLGSCFFSRQIERAFTLNESVMPFVDNTDMFEKIIVFDHLVFNSDRNRGNLLLKSNKREKVLYAIDHTHVFKNQAIWDSVCLRQGIAEGDYCSELILECNEASYDLFASAKSITFSSLNNVAKDYNEKCDEKLVSTILQDLPKDWLISNTDIEALRDYLLYRAEHLTEICQMIVKKRGWKYE